MTNEGSAISLERLHDIVAPPPIPWWPPAPGWYVVIGIVLLLLAIFAVRAWLRWRANGYRREALRELTSAPDPAAVAALLRRTAFAGASRREIAPLTGEAWLDWLAARSPEPIPASVREQLTAGVYDPDSCASDLNALRTWAAGWIRGHRMPVSDDG